MPTINEAMKLQVLRSGGPGSGRHPGLHNVARKAGFRQLNPGSYVRPSHGAFSNEHRLTTNTNGSWEHTEHQTGKDVVTKGHGTNDLTDHFKGLGVLD